MEKLTIMAFTPHPDDAELLCAGTLAKYKDQGHNVCIAIATNGNAGNIKFKPTELAMVRERESREAAQVIGAEFIWLGIEDEFLLNNKETRLQFVEAIRGCRADIILTCDSEDYHPDHKMISELVFDASFTASLPLVETESGALTKVPSVYYFDTVYGINFIPEEYVDITKYIDTKIEMLSKHKTQLEFMREYYKMDMIEDMKVVAQFRGLQCGVRYAEGFRVMRVFPRMKTERELPS